jgi:hypothetical protein
MVNKDVAEGIKRWRSQVWVRDYGDSLFGPEGILTDVMVKNLASVGPILRLAELELVVGSQWAWFGQYGDDLLAVLLGMSIPPVMPKAPEVRGTKRLAAQLAAQEERGLGCALADNGGRKERAAKKARVETDASEEPRPAAPTLPHVNVNTTFTPPARFHPPPTFYPATHLATPIVSQTRSSSSIYSASPSTLPTTPITHHAVTTNGFMLPYPITYYSSYPYHMPTFYLDCPRAGPGRPSLDFAGPGSRARPATPGPGPHV